MSNSSFSWWRPSPTEVGAHLGFQDQSVIKLVTRARSGSVFDDPHMDRNLIR